VIASLRGSEPIVTPLESLDLSNPKGFAEWFDTHVHSFGYSIQELSQRVAAIGTPLASFRAGSMLIASTGLGEWVEQAKAHFARALESNDTVLQCFTMIRLTGLETRTSLHGLSRFATGTQGVVPLLEHELNRLERLESKSPFALEAISKAHQGIGDAHMLSGDYAKADLHFLLAIELSEALGLKSAAERNRAWHATTLFAAGRVKHSLFALQNVIATSSNPIYIEAAIHGYAVALLELGEDETALSWLEHHEVCPGLKTLALAWAGRGGEDSLPASYLDELGPESTVNLECLNVLLRNYGQPAAHDLHGVSSIVRKSKEEAPFWRAYTALFQSLAALRLGEVQLAAAHFEDIPDVPEEHLACLAVGIGARDRFAPAR
jgi:tetratricopeptide (TPR) repeat protein